MTLGHLKESECPLPVERYGSLRAANAHCCSQWYLPPKIQAFFSALFILHQAWFIGSKEYSGSDGVWILRLCPGHFHLVLLAYFGEVRYDVVRRHTNSLIGDPHHKELRHLSPASTYQPAEWAILRLASSSHRRVSLVVASESPRKARAKFLIQPSCVRH